MKLNVGDAAPSFEAPDQNEELQDLEDYVGQWILLYFYPKDNTSGCTTEACSFRDRMDELKQRAVVLGVSADSVESHKQFASDHNLNFPLLSDPDRVIHQAYGVGSSFAKRSSFLISPEGIIQRIYDQVDPKKHAGEVHDDLIQLQGFDNI